MSDSAPSTDAFPKPVRLLVAYLGFAVVLPAFSGASLTMRAAHGAFPITTIEAAPQFVASFIVNAVGASTSVSSAALSLLVWSHGLDVDAVLRARVRAVAGALAAATLGTWLTTAVALLVSALSFHHVYDVPWPIIARPLADVRIADVVLSAPKTVVDVALTAIAMWLVLPAFARTRWWLPVKLVVLWAGMLVVRTGVSYALVSSGISR